MEMLEGLFNRLTANHVGFVNLYFWDLLVGVICLILLYAFANPDEEGIKKKNWIGILVTLVAYSIFFFARHKNVNIDFTGFNFGKIDINWSKTIFAFIFIAITILHSRFIWIREWPDTRIKVQSLVSFLIFMLSVLTTVLFNLYWIIAVAVLSYFIACVYTVPIRRRWVITIFERPFFSNWILIRKSKKFNLEFDVITCVDSQDSVFLDNGYNIILLASWLPGFNLIPLDYVRTEKRFQTEQLPTNDPEDDDTAGGTLSIDYKVWFKINYWPKNFLKLDDDDRNDLDNVIKRIIEGILAERISKVNGLNMAMTMDSKDKDDILKADGSREIQSIISNDVLVFMKKEILKHTGALLMNITILDRNPDEIIQKEQNKLTVTRTQIEEAKLQKQLQEALGAAEGAKVVAQLRSIQRALATNNDKEDPDVSEMDKAQEGAVSLFTILKTMESNNKIILPAGLLDKLGSVLST